MTTGTRPRLSIPPTVSDHRQGPVDAPVTLVEYGDYECQYCRNVHPIIRDLQERLGDNLSYVFRHFPIPSAHPNAQFAAEAAEAAANQGKFWEMHDYLFSDTGSLEPVAIYAHAESIGLDMHLFRQQMEEHAYADAIRDGFLTGVRSGVNGTPTFFINDVRYDGAWDFESLLEAIQKPIGVRISLLGQEFARMAASGGIVLMLMTIVALIWANSASAESYFHLWETSLGIFLGGLEFEEHLLHWVNDGLMVIFFFVVGLEIKREITAGELADPRKAALPIAGAIGGMVFPALLYLAFNVGGPGTSGWGVPMATDIAFTLGLLTVMSRRVPLPLRVFFAALAIADDLGAVLVIAIFYTSNILWGALGIAAVIMVALILLNRARIYSPLPYSLLGIGLWLAFLQSGVHPTIAGVLLAMTIPTRSPANTGALLAQCVTVLDEVDRPGVAPHIESLHQAATQTLETITDRMQSPAQRLERDLHPWTTFLILPLFALANAGVEITTGAAGEVFTPVSLGIVAGLVIGKPLGISLVSWLAVRLGIADLPDGVDWKQFISATTLAGIGFTMSLFIAGAAFDDPAVLANAKLGIIIASVLAGVLGTGLILLTSKHYDEHTRILIDAETIPLATSDS